MKRLLKKAVILTSIILLFSYSILAFEMAPPTFTSLDEFYTWALLDMRHTHERGDQDTIDEHSAIIDEFRSILDKDFWIDTLSENSLQAVVRIEDMFPAISLDSLGSIRYVEVNDFWWDTYRIQFDNGITIWVHYDPDREFEQWQYLPYSTDARIDDIYIAISLPSRANVPGRPDLDREAEAFYEEFFANDALRPLSDLFSLDDTVREAAEQALTENVREHAIFFDGTYIPMDIWDNDGTSSSHLVLFVLIGTGVMLIGGAALWLLLWKRRGLHGTSA